MWSGMASMVEKKSFVATPKVQFLAVLTGGAQKFRTFSAARNSSFAAEARTG
jgi:hypothetical protein